MRITTGTESNADSIHSPSYDSQIHTNTVRFSREVFKEHTAIKQWFYNAAYFIFSSVCVECVCLSRACSCVRSLLSEPLYRTLKNLCVLHLLKISNWTNFCSYQPNRTHSLPFQFERVRSIRNENMTKQMKTFNMYICSILGRLKLFPESLNFWEIQNSTMNSPCANIHFCQRL